MREEEVCLVVPSNRQPSTTGKCRKPNLSSQSGWTDGNGACQHAASACASASAQEKLQLSSTSACQLSGTHVLPLHPSPPVLSCPAKPIQRGTAVKPVTPPSPSSWPNTFPEFPSPQIVLLPNVSPRLEVNATSPRRWSPIVPMEVFPPMTSTKPRRQDKSTDHGRRLYDAKQPSYQTIKQAFAKVWPESHNACFFFISIEPSWRNTSTASPASPTIQSAGPRHPNMRPSRHPV